jgi:hypothetical protein
MVSASGDEVQAMRKGMAAATALWLALELALTSGWALAQVPDTAGAVIEQVCQDLGGCREWQSAVSQCQSDDSTCHSDLASCETQLASCEASPPVTTVLATGQTTKYAAGDDGDLKKGALLSYSDNGDGTITDNNTGLVWEKKVAGDGYTSSTDLHDVDNYYLWTGICSGNGYVECDADADCPTGQTCHATDGQGTGMTIFRWVAALNAANFAGHDDWRIPNVNELLSIVHYGDFDPPIHPAFRGANCAGRCTDIASAACSCTQLSDAYWSSTTSAGNPHEAWSVWFRYGLDFWSFKNGDSGKRYIRAVRGGS